SWTSFVRKLINWMNAFPDRRKRAPAGALSFILSDGLSRLIKTLPRIGLGAETHWRFEPFAIFLGELVSDADEIIDADRIDMAHRSAGPWCKTPTEYRAKVR